MDRNFIFHYHLHTLMSMRVRSVRNEIYTSLPPASEGWGKVIFLLCVSVHTSTGGGQVPRSGLDGGGEVGTPARSGWGATLARS